MPTFWAMASVLYKSTGPIQVEGKNHRTEFPVSPVSNKSVHTDSSEAALRFNVSKLKKWSKGC